MLQRPAHLANRQGQKLDDFMGGLGISQPPRISIKDDRFTLLDETGMTLADPTLSVDVVIVGVNKNPSRIFYEKKRDANGNVVPYDPNNHDAPLCWSDNGVGPSKGCSVPQAPTCSACPNAVWGSATGQGGKPIPACSTVKKLAVMVGGHEGLFLMQVPPGSIGSFKQYLSTVARMPASPEELVTRVKMENKELLFEAVDFIPTDELITYIDELIKNDDAASIVNRFDEARDPNEFNQARLAQHLPAPALVATDPAIAAKQILSNLPAPRGRPRKVVQEVMPPQKEWGNSIGVTNTPPPPPQAAPQPPQQGFGFGMQQQPQAPDPGVQGMLDNAFKLPRRT